MKGYIASQGAFGRHCKDVSSVDVSALFPVPPFRIWIIGGPMNVNLSDLFDKLRVQMKGGQLNTRFMQIELRQQMSRGVGKLPPLPHGVRKRWTIPCNLAALSGLPLYKPISQAALGNWRRVIERGLDNARGGGELARPGVRRTGALLLPVTGFASS